MSAAFDQLASEFASRLADDLVEGVHLKEYFRQLFLHFHLDDLKKDDVIALCAVIYPDIHAAYLTSL